MFIVTTTGTVGTVTLSDLPTTRVITHPETDLDLELEYTVQDLSQSADLQTAIDAGEIVAKNELGNVTEDVSAAGTHAEELEDEFIKLIQENSGTGGAPVQSVNGEIGTVILETDDISEGSTNLYYTNTRADGRIAVASIDDLSDVDTVTITPTSGDNFNWDGSNWTPLKNTLTATAPPTINDDTTQGYQVGSTVIDITNDKGYICIDSTSGAAKWQEITAAAGSGNATERPKRIFIGSLLNYPNQGSRASSEIDYIQVFIQAGIELTQMEVFLDSNANGSIRIGIYDQVDPDASSGSPNAKVAETNSTSLSNSDNGTFKELALISNYLIPQTGYYWLAFVSTNNGVKYAASDSFREGYLPYYKESSSGTTLPATASAAMYSTVESLVYYAAIRV